MRHVYFDLFSRQWWHAILVEEKDIENMLIIQIKMVDV